MSFFGGGGKGRRQDDDDPYNYDIEPSRDSKRASSVKAKATSSPAKKHTTAVVSSGKRTSTEDTAQNAMAKAAAYLSKYDPKKATSPTPSRGTPTRRPLSDEDDDDIDISDDDHDDDGDGDPPSYGSGDESASLGGAYATRPSGGMGSRGGAQKLIASAASSNSARGKAMEVGHRGQSALLKRDMEKPMRNGSTDDTAAAVDMPSSLHVPESKPLSGLQDNVQSSSRIEETLSAFERARASYLAAQDDDDDSLSLGHKEPPPPYTDSKLPAAPVASIHYAPPPPTTFYQTSTASAYKPPQTQSKLVSGEAAHSTAMNLSTFSDGPRFLTIADLSSIVADDSELPPMEDEVHVDTALHGKRHIFAEEDEEEEHVLEPSVDDEAVVEEVSAAAPAGPERRQVDGYGSDFEGSEGPVRGAAAATSARIPSPESFHEASGTDSAPSPLEQQERPPPPQIVKAPEFNPPPARPLEAPRPIVQPASGDRAALAVPEPIRTFAAVAMQAHIQAQPPTPPPLVMPFCSHPPAQAVKRRTKGGVIVVHDPDDRPIETNTRATQCVGNHAGVQADLYPTSMRSAIPGRSRNRLIVGGVGYQASRGGPYASIAGRFAVEAADVQGGGLVKEALEERVLPPRPPITAQNTVLTPQPYTAHEQHHPEPTGAQLQPHSPPPAQPHQFRTAPPPVPPPPHPASGVSQAPWPGPATSQLSQVLGMYMTLLRDQHERLLQTRISMSGLAVAPMSTEAAGAGASSHLAPAARPATRAPEEDSGQEGEESYSAEFSAGASSRKQTGWMDETCAGRLPPTHGRAVDVHARLGYDPYDCGVLSGLDASMGATQTLYKRQLTSMKGHLAQLRLGAEEAGSTALGYRYASLTGLKFVNQGGGAQESVDGGPSTDPVVV